jgi:hypothetical protein
MYYDNLLLRWVVLKILIPTCRDSGLEESLMTKLYPSDSIVRGTCHFFLRTGTVFVVWPWGAPCMPGFSVLQQFGSSEQPVGLTGNKYIIHPEYSPALRYCDPDLSVEAVHA